MGTPKTVRFDENVEKLVEKYLEANGIKFSQLVNMAVKKFISEPQSIELAPIETAKRNKKRRGQAEAMK